MTRRPVADAEFRSAVAAQTEEQRMDFSAWVDQPLVIQGEPYVTVQQVRDAEPGR